MAYPIQQAVIEFHKKYGHPVRETPQTIDADEAEQAYGFIEEECMELWEAVGIPVESCGAGCCEEEPYSPNLIEIADALGDVVFTAYGMAIRHGIDLDRVLHAIVESNMTKTANGMGKIKKGPEYIAPRIAEALTV